MLLRGREVWKCRTIEEKECKCLQREEQIPMYHIQSKLFQPLVQLYQGFLMAASGSDLL